MHDQTRSIDREQLIQALGGQFKGGAGARAGLVEPVDHEAPLQERHLLDVPAVEVDVPLVASRLP